MSTKIVKKLLAADVTDFIQDTADLAQSNAEAYADQKIADLVDSAPATLDTLNELAAALNDDANFAATVAGQIGALQGEIDAAEGDISALDGRVTTAEGDIAALEGRMDTAESDIDGLQSELDATQAGAGLGVDGSYVVNGAANYISAASSLAAADNALDSAIKLVSDDLVIAQGDIVALEGRMDTAESDIAALESADLALSGRLDIIEGADTVEGSVAKAEKDAKDYTDAREIAITSAYQAYADQAEADAVSAANAYTDAEIAALVDSAPAVLDTLNELAQALGEDPNFATTIAGQIGTIQSDITALDGRLDIIEGADTVEGSVAKAEKDAKDYTDAEVALLEAEDLTFVKLDGSRAMSGDLDMGGNQISDVADPVLAQDAATKAYVDGLIAGVNSAAEISFAPAGDIVATNVQAAIEEVEADYKAYADQAELDAIVSANSYTDGREVAITTAYEAYADQAELDAKAYADQAELDAIASANSYTDAEVAVLEAEDLTFLKLDGTRPMTGPLDMNGAAINGAASVSATGPLSGSNVIVGTLGIEIDGASISKFGTDFVMASGLELTGNLNLNDSYKVVNLVDPTAAQDAATKAYVDSVVAGVNEASEISFAPAGDIAATNVQAAIEELESDYKAYADQAELDAIASANSYTDGEVAAINAAALVGVKSAKTLDATDITNQYVDLAHEIKADTLIVVFRGLVLEQGPAGGPNADYSVSTVGGVTRVTFEGDFASAGTSALVANDRLRFQYLRPAGV